MISRSDFDNLPHEITSHLLTFCSLSGLGVMSRLKKGFFQPLDENKIWQEKTRTHFPHVYARYTHPEACNDWKTRFKEIYDQEYAGLHEHTRTLLTIAKEGYVGGLQPLDGAEPTDNKPRITISFDDIHKCTDNAKLSLVDWARTNKCQAMLNYFYALAKKQLQAGTFEYSSFTQVIYDKKYYPAYYQQPVAETMEIIQALINFAESDTEKDNQVINEHCISTFKKSSMKLALELNNRDIAEYPLVIDQRNAQQILLKICKAGNVGLLKSTWKAYRTSNAQTNLNELLESAIAADQLEIVKFLAIQDGVDINHPEYTPLITALLNKRDKIVKYLLELPYINVNVSHNSLSALHYATSFNQITSVISLLARGAKINALDSKNRKPVEMTRNKKIQNILWLFECLHKLNVKPSPHEKSDFTVLNQSFRVPLKDILAFHTLSDVILDKAKPEALEPFRDNYAQYSDLENILTNIAWMDKITKKHEANKGIIEQNKFIYLDAIEDFMRIINITTEPGHYDLHGTAGDGLYQPYKEVIGDYLYTRQLYYIEEDCTGTESFINEMITDISYKYMFNTYNLHNMITDGPIANAVTSYPNDLYQGHKGMREFWDVDTVTFDWDKFRAFAERVNVSASEDEMKKLRPISKTGKEVMPFADQVKRLRERLLREESALKLDRPSFSN